MISTVRDGRANTAMKPFVGLLSAVEIAAVVDFIRSEFIARKNFNTRYHTRANGWPDHDRHEAAYPFATGEIPLDTPWEQLTPSQRGGWRMYFESCISCHDRSQVSASTLKWERQALSFPTAEPALPDGRMPAAGNASDPAFVRHESPSRVGHLSGVELRGENLYLANCAFCHAPDGSAQHWIGQFLDPHPRNLTDPGAMAGVTPSVLRRVIRDGLYGTSMPAWGSVLSKQEIDAIVAYVMRVFHSPNAFQGELPPASPDSGQRK
jgi:cytochrome c oxidase cbb3-type subunit 3